MEDVHTERPWGNWVGIGHPKWVALNYHYISVWIMTMKLKTDLILEDTAGGVSSASPWIPFLQVAPSPSQAALWSYQATHHFLPRPPPRPPASPVSFENIFNLQCWLLKSTPDTTVKYSTPRPCHSQPDLLKLILFITQKLEHSSWMVTNSNLISLQPWTEKWPSHFASIHFLGGPDSSASPVVSQSCRNGPWWSLRWRWRLFAFSTMETSLGRI